MTWETFLENVFLRYMCGAQSANGFSPTLLFKPKSNLSVAMGTLLRSNWQYLNWNSSSTLNWANTYFDQGEPFSTAIRAITLTLGEITAVRNRFAHRSDFALREFREVVLKSFGYIPRGINPGRFLLMINQSSPTGNQNFLNHYANSLLGASYSIVP